ncbi:retrovirus-related pol polyprotein from transposon TNT 1-94 [Tanacetum coccineum]
MTLDIQNWPSSVHQEIYKIVKDEIFPIVNQVDARVQNFKIQFMKEAAKFVRDFQSLAKDADESLAKHKALEYEIERLLRAVFSRDIMSLVQNNSVVETSDLQTELERTKERSKTTTAKTRRPSLGAIQRNDENTTKGTSVNTQFSKQSILGKPPSYSQPKLYSVTPFPKSMVSLKSDETNALLKPVTSNSAPSSRESTVGKNDKVIAPGMFRINPFKTSREENVVPNKPLRASVRTKPIIVSQPSVSHMKTVNSNSNGSSSTGVDHTDKTRRLQPRSNTKNDRVPSASKSSGLKNKEAEVEEHSCLIPANHDVCVLKYVNDMNSRDTKQTANVSKIENQKKQKTKFKKPKKVGSKEILASPTRSEPSICHRWSPTGIIFDCNGKIIKSRASKGQSDNSNGDNACTSNPQEPSSKRFLNSTSFLGRFSKFVYGTVRFGNDHIAVILGYGDLQWGNILITRVYFIKGLGHNLFSAGQFCNSDLEVAFRRNTCYVRNLKGVDLLKGNRITNLYTINLHDMASASPICLIARATSTKSLLWHQRLSHLNFDTINDLARNDLVIGLLKFKYHKEHLCPSCEQGKSKKASHPPKPVPNSKQRLHLLHMDLCGPMRIESINGKRYVLVIVDDYSRYTWVHFLISKDEAPKVIKTFLKKIIVLLQALVIIVRTDNGTKFKNQVLKEYFDSVGISHQTCSVRTPQQNGVVERRNRTLVEDANTMLIFLCALLFLWAEAIATACYTQNCSIIHRQFDKTPYELINGRKPDISFLHVFGALVYNRRTKKIMETMNVTFDELSAMAFEQRSSKPELQSMTSGQISLGLDLTYAPSTITTQKPTECELDLLFEAMYNDYIGGKPSSATKTTPAAQAPQVLQTPTASTTTTDSAPTPTNSSPQAIDTPITSQNVDELELQQQHIQQQENHAPLQPEIVADNVLNAILDGNSFINPFATPSTSAAESSSSQYVDPSNMHITMEPSNVKEAMKDPAWIDSMQEELLQFKRLDVWELVPLPDNIKALTLKWLFKNKVDEENTVITH